MHPDLHKDPCDSRIDFKDITDEGVFRDGRHETTSFVSLIFAFFLQYDYTPGIASIQAKFFSKRKRSAWGALRIGPIARKSGVFSDFGKAFAAVNRSVGFWLKGNASFISACGAYGGEVFSRASGSGFARIAAFLAPLGFVLESPLGVEFLLTGGENELFSALLAY
jgi:hypothetical protein